MPTGTSYNPDSNDQLSKKALVFNGQGVFGTCNTSGDTNFDIKLADDHIITGLIYNINMASFGDYFRLQVVDRDGVYYPAGTVLAQFANNWYVSTQAAGTPLSVGYPAKIIAGLVLRLIYTATGTVGAQLSANYYLHKVLN